MVSRIRKNSKRLKRSLKKNKYIGGITSKSGLHAFFVNKAEWIKLFGEVVNDKNAPSIKDIEEKLKGKGYYIAEENIFIDLIGVDGSWDSSSYENHFLQSACNGIRKKYHDMLYEAYYKDENIICHAARLKERFFSRDEKKIQDVFVLIRNYILFSNIVKINKEEEDNTFSIEKNPLNIDYCVVIDVSRVQKNIFKKSVDYLQNEESDMSVKYIASKLITDDSIRSCLDNKDYIIYWIDIPSKANRDYLGDNFTESDKSLTLNNLLKCRYRWQNNSTEKYPYFAYQ